MSVIVRERSPLKTTRHEKKKTYWILKFCVRHWPIFYFAKDKGETSVVPYKQDPREQAVLQTLLEHPRQGPSVHQFPVSRHHPCILRPQILGRPSLSQVTHRSGRKEKTSMKQSMNESINQSINQSVSQSVSHSVSQSVSQSVNQSIHQLINQFYGRGAGDHRFRPYHPKSILTGSLSGPYFAIRTAKMDRSRTDFTDLCL